MKKTILALSCALGLSGCFGGAKVPDTLMTLTPAQARTAATTRTAAEGEAITVVVPTAARELQTLRVPVQESAVAVSYLVLLEMGWQLFFEDGTHYSANASGSKVKKVG